MHPINVTLVTGCVAYPLCALYRLCMRISQVKANCKRDELTFI